MSLAPGPSARRSAAKRAAATESPTTESPATESPTTESPATTPAFTDTTVAGPAARGRAETGRAATGRAAGESARLRPAASDQPVDRAEPPAATDRPLYEQLAAHIEQAITSGALRIGQRVPSVRSLSRQHGVSIATVLAAYRLLEDRSLIQPRPQSGYYVRSTPAPPPELPEITRPSKAPTAVSNAEIIYQFLREAGRPSIIPLGAACPSTDQMPIRTLSRIAASIARRAPLTSNAYDLPPGCAALRRAVARCAVDAGVTVSPDQIVTTTGSTEAISLCLRVVAKAGDTVAIESPTYYGVLQTIASLGMKALEIPTCPRDGISLDALRYALDQSRVKAVLLQPSFNNPLGSSMPVEARKAVVAMLSERRIPLIEDDIYGDLPFQPTGRLPACKAFDTEGWVLLCSGFSKTLSSGMRVGWCAPGRFFDDVARLKVFSTFASATLPQMAVAEFLESGGYERHLRKIRRVYASQVQRIRSLVGQYFPPGTRATDPAGGFVLWIELDKSIDSTTLHEAALRNDISIAPGPIFSASGRYRHFIRLNCGLQWTDRIEPAIERLGQLIRER